MPGNAMTSGSDSAARRRRRMRACVVFIAVAAGVVAALMFPGEGHDADGRSTGPPATIHLHAGDSLNDAVYNAVPGQTLILHGGRYASVWITRDFSPSLTIEAAAGERPVLDGLNFTGPAGDVLVRGVQVRPPSDDEVAVRIESGSHHITLSGLTVAGGLVGVRVSSARRTSWPQSIRIDNSEVSGARLDNVYVSGAIDLTLVQNWIHDPQVNGAHNDGVQAVAARGLVIEHNRFFFEHRGPVGPNQAIILGREDPAQPGREVEDSRVVGNLIHSWHGTGIVLAGTRRTLIAHNTVVDNGADNRAASLVMSAKNDPLTFGNEEVHVVNNILYRFDLVDGATRPGVERNNLVEQGGGGEDLIVGPPGFSSLGQHELDERSPAIDSAVPGYAPGTDLRGKALRGTPDRGALEYWP